jgi:NTP pyrophosphatase (non-canonical NTP hydrolase)
MGSTLAGVPQNDDAQEGALTSRLRLNLPPSLRQRRLEEGLEIRTAQQLIMDNKRHKGFNTSDVPLELCLLQGEITEFFHAWRRGQPDAAEELADVAIYVFGLASLVGVDLQAEITAKIEKNAKRRYERRNGVPMRVTYDSSDPTASA